MSHKTERTFLTIVILAIAGCRHSTSGQKESSAPKQSNAPKVLFVYQAPGDQTTRVGSFYSTDDMEAVSFTTSEGKPSPIPFQRIRQMTLTKHSDFDPSPCSPSLIYPPSDVTVDIQNGGSVKGCIGPYNLLFIDPEKDQPIEIDSTDPTDTAKHSVNQALGVFKRKPEN